jgi:rhodanese-related sulfurtransferase
MMATSIASPPSASSSSKKEKKCFQVSKNYQNQFPDIPPMSSRELLQRNLDDNLIIIDVRTNPERQVSMIPGAISLTTFEQEVLMVHNNNNTDTTIVTYCTIGYRSGMEARRLRQRYHLKNIYNLDGILAYTHALAAACSLERNENGNELLAAAATTRQLIRPNDDSRNIQQQQQQQQQPIETNQVHTFGAVWNLAHDGYETQHYPMLVFLGRTAQVGGTTVLRTFQRLVVVCSSCCGREKLH